MRKGHLCWRIYAYYVDIMRSGGGAQRTSTTLQKLKIKDMGYFCDGRKRSETEFFLL